MKGKVLSIILALILIFHMNAPVYAGVMSTATQTRTAAAGIATRAQILATAKSKLNISVAEYNPFTHWYGPISGTYNYAWCQVFVSWVAAQNNANSIIPVSASCLVTADWFRARGAWRTRGQYIPQPGDLVFFDWGSNGGYDHVGYVEYTDNGTLYTVEGNSGKSVKQRSYKLDDREIIGYALPAYPASGTVVPTTTYSDNCSCSDAYAGTYTATGASVPLKIRSGHGTDYAIVGQIPMGAADVKVLKASGTWAHVSYNGLTGYACMDYLVKTVKPVVSEVPATQKEETTIQAVPKEEQVQTKAVVTQNISVTDTCKCKTQKAGTYKTKSKVVIYSGHGTKFSRIGNIPKGKKVDVTKANGTWAHVTYQGMSGYVKVSKLKKVSSKSSVKESCSCKTTNAGYYRCISSSSLVVRSGHGTSFSGIGMIPSGAYGVFVNKTDGKWAHITYYDLEGFVPMDSLIRV